MLLIFPSNLAIGFSVLQTIYRSFFFSCFPFGKSEMGNSNQTSIFKELIETRYFLFSPSFPSFPLLLFCTGFLWQARPSCSAWCCNDSGNAQVRWCRICYESNHVCWINVINSSSSSLRPRVSQRALWPVLSAQPEVHLSEGFSLGDCLLSLCIWSICKALGTHCHLVPQKRHPKAWDNVQSGAR